MAVPPTAIGLGRRHRDRGLRQADRSGDHGHAWRVEVTVWPPIVAVIVFRAHLGRGGKRGRIGPVVIVGDGAERAAGSAVSSKGHLQAAAGLLVAVGVQGHKGHRGRAARAIWDVDSVIVDLREAGRPHHESA